MSQQKILGKYFIGQNKLGQKRLNFWEVTKIMYD